MSQKYHAHAWADNGTSLADIIGAQLPESMEALGTFHSGTAEPSPTFPRMFWADEFSGLLKQRTLANDGWVDLAPLDSTWAHQVASQWTGTVAASMQRTVLIGPALGVRILSLRICTGDAISSSMDDTWDFQLRNLTTGLDLLATALSTSAGVAANSTITALVDQNAQVSSGDILAVIATKSDTPESLTESAFQVEFLQGM